MYCADGLKAADGGMVVVDTGGRGGGVKDSQLYQAGPPSASDSPRHPGHNKICV